MKSIALTLIACLTLIVYGDNSKDTKSRASELAQKILAEEKRTKKPTRAELEQRPEVLKKTGGFIDVAAKGISVAVLDARRKPGGAVDQFAEVFERLSKTKVNVEKKRMTKSGCPVNAAKDRLVSTKAAYSIVIADLGDNVCGLTVMPEDRIAIINATKYADDDDPLQPEIRIIKELWRGLGFVMGLGYAKFTNDVLQPTFSVSELDSLVYQVMQPMNFLQAFKTMSRFGVTRARHIPYRLAVMEGWAPSPTNEYQKAIWEQVKADKERGPTNPIKIPMPKKR